MAKTSTDVCMLWVCVLVVSRSLLCECQNLLGDDEVIYGYNNYTEYIKGSDDTRIIISIPHGGYQRPDDIPDRSSGCYDSATDTCTWRHDCGETSSEHCKASILSDMYTTEIGVQLHKALHHLTGERPFLVRNSLHRRKLDANRDVDEAAMGVEDAVRAWNDFHGFLAEARGIINERSPGLVLDVHGQGHAEGWVELGYLFKSEELDQDVLNFTASSIRSVAERNDDNDDKLIRGSTSVGGLLQWKGYKSVPSSAHPGPAGGRYYSGGYITQVYGSKDGGRVDCIQLENPRHVRNADNYTMYADTLAFVVDMYMARFYYPENREDDNDSSEERSKENNSQEDKDGEDDKKDTSDSSWSTQYSYQGMAMVVILTTATLLL